MNKFKQPKTPNEKLNWILAMLVGAHVKIDRLEVAVKNLGSGIGSEDRARLAAGVTQLQDSTQSLEDAAKDPGA